jgi:ribonuclease HI
MKIYVDGSAQPNPGKGGFGLVAMEDDVVCYAYAHHEDETTNNRQELKGILLAMVMYGDRKNIDVYSDSAYAVNTFNNWMFSWERNGWVKSDGQTPENIDLIKAYYKLYKEGYRIDLRKVKGHANNEYNNLADKLATNKITEEEVLNGRK